MARHLLIVEDGRDVQLILRAALEDNFTLTFAETLADADRYLKGESQFDLILLDVVLPDGTGFDLLSRIQKEAKTKSIPVIILTGQDQVDSRVKGLDLGAEDYVLKPFDSRELVARIHTRLRRDRSIAGSQTTFQVAGFSIDIAAQTVSLALGSGVSKQLMLTRIEFKLLVHFLRNPDKVFTRGDLLREVWGGDTHVSEHTVDTHISALRKKIEGGLCQLKSVPKKGYQSLLSSKT